MPEIVFVAEVLVCQAEVIATPGAIMSTQLPILLKDAIESLLALAATVMAPGTLAGEELHAFVALFPAATTTVTPSLIKLLIAVSRVDEIPPPKLKFATALLVVWFLIAQLIPAITPELVPDQRQSKTRTGIKLTDFATP